MSKDKPSNPWADRDLEKEVDETEEHDPAQIPGEAAHSEDVVEKDIDDEIDELEQAEQTLPEGDEWRAELKKAQDQLVRAEAEMQNMRRRSTQELERAHKYGLEKFVQSLLDVVDSMEHALNAGKVGDPMYAGIEMTLKMFFGVLEKVGVEAINPVNEKFDPQQHEAMSMQPNKDVDPNTVIEVYQKGYLLNGRLVRPARVVVSQ